MEGQGQSDHVAPVCVRNAGLIPANALQALWRQCYTTTWTCCQVHPAFVCPPGSRISSSLPSPALPFTARDGLSRCLPGALPGAAPRCPGSILRAPAATHLCRARLNTLWQGELPPGAFKWGAAFQIFKRKRGESRRLIAKQWWGFIATVTRDWG